MLFVHQDMTGLEEIKCINEECHAFYKQDICLAGRSKASSEAREYDFLSHKRTNTEEGANLGNF